MREFIKESGAEGIFDSATLKILVGAFDDAWKSLQTSGAPFAAENYTATARNVLAKYIIEAAKSGERDRHRLSEGALLQLARTKLRSGRRSGQ
jgi:hypothetical protein